MEGREDGEGKDHTHLHPSLYPWELQTPGSHGKGEGQRRAPAPCLAEGSGCDSRVCCATRPVTAPYGQVLLPWVSFFLSCPGEQGVDSR